MMRSLWTAASGMTSQQMSVDVISNNLSNVNTTSYKKERVEFKTLLYETVSKSNADGSGNGSPVGIQIGHGVRPSAIGTDHTKGSFQRSDNLLDFAIDGDGYFAIQLNENEVAYTRDGSFKLSPLEGGGYILVTSAGHPILDTNGEQIEIPAEVSVKDLSVSPEGILTYVDENKEVQDLGAQLDVVQFANREGLEKIGGNNYLQTAASGEPMKESEGDVGKTSTIVQGFLEMSNVQLAEEMVKLIVAQRAYEVNSKAIQTSDDMLQTANQLKR